MHCLIRSLAQTLCDDLARAEKAKDGKNGTCPTPLRIFRQLFSASHLPVQSPARLRLIVFFVLSVGLFGPPLSLV